MPRNANGAAGPAGPAGARVMPMEQREPAGAPRSRAICFL